MVRRAGNIFSNKIRVDVAVYFLIRRGVSERLQSVCTTPSVIMRKLLTQLDYFKVQSLADYAFGRCDVRRQGVLARSVRQRFRNFGDDCRVGKELHRVSACPYSGRVCPTFFVESGTNSDEWAYDFAVLEEGHKCLAVVMRKRTDALS